MNEIDKPYIESRVTDWLQRIGQIYDSVRNTLGNVRNIECLTTRKVVMHEELMQKYNVAPTDVPILDINKSDKLLASFKPIGLWVIGANGRIDILTKDGAFILVDVSEKGAQSNWKVYTPKNRKDGRIFDSSFINDLVSSL